MKVEFSVPGYELVRPLSERAHSRLFLAQRGTGAEREWVAIKLEFPQAQGKTQAVLKRYAKLRNLAIAGGFARIMEFGESGSGWVWHCLPLADNLPGLPPLNSPAGVIEYTPLTLAAWTLQNGPAPAVQVAAWGMRVCGALRVLHEAGLVHRDVKPTNLLFIGGQICLADYGLVGEPGSQHDFSGTEGFIPWEGTLDVSADVYALGKTLYQAWSGKDRLEFPSLPLRLTEGEDWKRYGARLNDVILRACHPQPGRRFHSAEDLSRELSDAVADQRKSSRRRWLTGVGAFTAVGASAFVFRRPRVGARVRWRRVGPEFNVEAFQGYFGTVDWSKRRLYSACREFAAFWFHSVDLDTFKTTVKQIEPLPRDWVAAFLHPRSGNLWAVEGGLGEVFEIDVESGTVKSLGGGPSPKTSFAPALYWNPLTDRLGSFGGYGFFKVHNRRYEFDRTACAWVEMAPDPQELPWPRQTGRLFPGPDSTRHFLQGGLGSPSGAQGKEVRGLRGFNGLFHFLDDLWELDLKTNRWTELLPNGEYPITPQSSRETCVFYHPKLHGIVLFDSPELSSTDHVGPSAWLFRQGLDRTPWRLLQEGERSRLGRPWAYALDPQSDELLYLAPDGIFRVAFDEPR